MINIKEEKALLRAEMKNRREAVPVCTRKAYSLDLCAKLEERIASLRKGKAHFTVAAYLATQDEIDVDPLISRLAQSGVRIAVPRWEGKTRTYALARLDAAPNTLAPGRFGIRESGPSAEPLLPADVDYWIVPGLAFTREGARLGYGGGYYDRFLASSREDAISAAVAYPFQIVDEIPQSGCDRSVDEVVVAAMKKPRTRPEILAPAGDWVSLRAAIQAGADAVYFGLGTFNMRARSGVNFTEADLPEIAKCCGAVKRYLTLNAIMFETELEKVEELIIAAKPYVDAFIVSDWGVASLCRRHGVDFHISTQMSASNSSAVEFLLRQGAKRVVLARECTLAEVAAIVEKTGAEIECFVHGAQCVAESGRCLMSHDAFGKSACRGECHQPCRRRFLVKAIDMYEDAEGRPVHESDTAFIVEGRTVLSAKDLCSIGFVDKLMAAGISSFKIEGRARNAEYVMTCVKAYRRAVDAVLDGSYTPELVAELREELEKVFHREFSAGLFYGRPGKDQMTDSEDSLATRVKRHVGIVIDYFTKAGIAQVKVQDHEIHPGDELQIHGATTGVVELVLGEMRRDDETPEVAKRGEWVTFRAPRCRVGDKVFFIEKRA